MKIKCAIKAAFSFFVSLTQAARSTGRRTRANSHPYLCPTVFVFAIFLASAARAQGPTLIGGRDFTLVSASLGGGTELVGSAANTANGLSANTPWGNSGDGISYRFNSPSEFRYDFVSPVTIDGSFYLYNGWDIQNQAVRSFSLSFLDSSGALVGSTFQGVGSPGINNEVFSLPQAYAGVTTAILRVESSHTPHVEFREVAFDGLTPCVPGDVIRNVLLPEVVLSLPVLKRTASLTFRFDPLGLNWTTQNPSDPEAICEASSNEGSLRASVILPPSVEMQGFSTAQATLTLFGGTMPRVRWSTPGFDVTAWDPLTIDLPFGWFDTGPIIREFPLTAFGASLDDSFETILRKAESHIHWMLSKEFFVENPRTTAPYRYLILEDPGTTDLLLTDPDGNRMGIDGSGNFVHEIGDGIYLSRVPLACVKSPKTGTYSLTIVGRESGPYEVISAIVEAGLTVDKHSTPEKLLTYADFRGELGGGGIHRYAIDVPEEPDGAMFVRLVFADSDGDAVEDAHDNYPLSDRQSTVVIGAKDSGVGNQVLPNGATFMDLILEALGNSKNRGDFVSDVARMTGDWVRLGLISGFDKGRIERCAAKGLGR